MGRYIRVGVTSDGRYVPDTDPDATHLVYAGDIDKAPVEVKMSQQAEDKQRKRKPRSKTAATPEPEATDSEG